MPFEQPRGRVSIDGVAVPGLVSLQVVAGGYFMAGRFRAGFALGADVAFGADYFSALTNQSVVIEAAPAGVGYNALLMGRVDSIRIDWLHRLVIVCGRDLTGLLIDTEIAESFVNQTASQIAVTIAGRHGLTPDVTSTAGLVGQYYQLDHARTALGVNARVTTEWDLLTALALAEGFVVSVAGDALNFGPPPAVMPVFLTPQNFMTMSFDMIVAMPGAVTAKSWNCRTKSVVAGTQGAGLTTTIIRPNLVQAQAERLAQGHLRMLGQHRMVLQGMMPGDVTLLPGMQIELAGTNSGLDQGYVVDAVTRRLDGKGGFFQDLMAHAVVVA